MQMMKQSKYLAALEYIRLYIIMVVFSFLETENDKVLKFYFKLFYLLIFLLYVI